MTRQDLTPIRLRPDPHPALCDDGEDPRRPIRSHTDRSVGAATKSKSRARPKRGVIGREKGLWGETRRRETPDSTKVSGAHRQQCRTNENNGEQGGSGGLPTLVGKGIDFEPPPGLQQFGERLGGKRPTEDVALNFVAPVLAQKTQLF